MANDENQAGERSIDTVNSDQQKESTNEKQKQSTAHEKEVTRETTKTGGRQEAQKGDQAIRNDKKETTRITRGREDWGGYQGY